MRFSIGYNEKEGFLEMLEKNKDLISSVYFPLPKDIGSSGRPSRQTSGDYYLESEELVKKCHELGIGTILLLNSTNDGESAFSKEKLSKLFSYIEKLISFGLTSITVTNLLYVKFLKAKFPKLEIYSSVNCRLKNVEQAIFFQKLGVQVLTLDRDINRDLEMIKKIKDRTGLKLQLMLNEPCIKNCPFRHTHFEAVANDSEQIFGVEFEDLTCYPMFKENKRMFFRIPFVRPEDLKHYDGIVDVYKLVTRDASNEKIEFLLKTYNNQSFDGNVVDLFDIEDSQYLSKLNIDNNKLNKNNFFEKISKCPGDCDKCFMCNIFL